MNMIMYKIDRWDEQSDIQLFVSKTEFDRSISYLVNGAESTRTVIFPSTVRDISYDAFAGNWSLLSTVLNEGLE